MMKLPGGQQLHVFPHHEVDGFGREVSNELCDQIERASGGSIAEAMCSMHKRPRFREAHIAGATD
jgi:hypothetical protein